MKVAVIGAGFSGMLASYLLEKEGIDVTVYEKESFIGGHCRTLLGKNHYTELGTTFSFSRHIKELLLELKVDYTERFIYRNFLDGDLNSVAHMTPEDAVLLMEELSKLKVLLDNYDKYLNTINYGYIPEPLLMPLSEFLHKHDLKTIHQLLAPHLSSFGFGNTYEIQAYYAFKVFNVNIIQTFLRGEKLLFINKGMSELIHQLSKNISDIRYSMEVISIEAIDQGAKVETTYGEDIYDKVLITTKLPHNVIKDYLFNQMMKKIDTNPYITCAYEVNNKNLATTYFKENLGKKDKVQFFHTTRQEGQTNLVAFTYGNLNSQLVKDITKDIEDSGIHIKRLITANQWYIFPHLNSENLTQYFYEDIHERLKNNPICLIGSLISHPSMANLYDSVKDSVNHIIGNT